MQEHCKNVCSRAEANSNISVSAIPTGQVSGLIKSMSGSVAATWLSIAHMSAHIFSCRGPRSAALLKIVQHHGEIPLVLVSPSWERSKGRRMPVSEECLGIQNPSRVISHYFRRATERLVLGGGLVFESEIIIIIRKTAFRKFSISNSNDLSPRPLCLGDISLKALSELLFLYQNW